MARFYWFVVFNTVFLFSVYSQPINQKPENTKRNVYKTKWYIDGPIIVGGLWSNYVLTKKVIDKEGADSAEVILLTPDDVNWFDRSAARQNPDMAEKAKKNSDYWMLGSFALPAVLLLNKNVRSEAIDATIITLATASISGNMYGLVVGHVNRKRPFVFNPNEPIGRRTGRGSQNSFFAGHPASVMSSTMLTAKMYHDMNPDSKFVPWIYGAAYIPPIIVAYYRYKAGMHFPTDIIAGLTIGSAVGYFVPHFHHRKPANLTLAPMLIGGTQGVYASYKF